jgi:DNA-binding response OmpR family regulator
LSIFGSNVPIGPAGDQAGTADPPAPTSQAPADDAQAPAAAGAGVVVVNPDDEVCEVLARVVEAAGYRAVRVTDGSKAVDATVSGSAAALVLDAGSSNLDLLRDLRAEPTGHGRMVRVAVVGTGPASARLAWQQGADAVLTRPFAAADVGRLLSAALARSEAEREQERRDQVAALGA